MSKRGADGSVRTLSRDWPCLDENLSQRTDMLQHAPTPSCMAFKAAFQESVLVSVPSFEVRRDAARRPTWSCLGRTVRRNGLEEGLSVCRECRDEDVMTMRSQPLWVGNGDSGFAESWWIGDAKCDSCRRRASLADSDYELPTEAGDAYFDVDEDEIPECVTQ